MEETGTTIHPELEARIRASTRRNFWCIGIFELVYTFGLAFYLPFTVIPAYLLHHHASKTLVQTVMTVLMLMTVLQIPGTRISHHPNRKRRLLLLWLLGGVPWCLYGLAALFLGQHLSPTLWVWLFILMALAGSTCGQLASPGYSEAIFLNIDKPRRGRFSSVLSFAIGLGGLGGAYLVAHLMKSLPPTRNFHAAFVIGSIIVILSTAIMGGMHDLQAEQYETLARPEAIRVLARRLWDNFNFRVFLLFFALLMAAQALGPLFIGYSADVLGSSDRDVGYFTLSYCAGMVLVGATVPLLADRFGFRIIGIIAALLFGCGFLLPLLLPRSMLALYAAYGLYAGSGILGMIVLANLGHEMIHDVPSSLVIAIGRSLVIPITLAVGPLSGLLVDLHGAAGYLAAFVTGLVLNLIAAAGFLLVTREPRTGEEIYVRIRRL